MSEWTWKQAVAEEVLKQVNRSRRLQFALQDIYEAEQQLKARFPRNCHIHEKIRQTLQRLRDMGMVIFLGSGMYEINPNFSDFDFEPTYSGEAGLEIPQFRCIVRTIRLRNTLLAADMKARYGNICQVCREVVRLVGSTYAESHHLKPLGSPHFGPDIEGNIIVVCPNHHVMFDRGALVIEPESLVVRHLADAIEPRNLLLEKWHGLNRSCLEYQYRKIKEARNC